MKKLTALKVMMRGTAEMLQDYCFQLEPNSPWVMAQSMRTFARVVWQQAWATAEALILKDPLARRHLKVENREVSILDFNEFSEESDIAQTYHLNEQAKHIEQTRSTDTKHLLGRVSDKAKLWIKHDKKLVLNGVLVEEEIIRDEPDKTLHLGKEWQRTFNAKQFDEEKAQAILDEIGDIGEYTAPHPPDIFTYMQVTKTRKKTATGPDAVPYCAYHNRHAAGTLLECDTLLRNGTPACEGLMIATVTSHLKGIISKESPRRFEKLRKRDLCRERTVTTSL